MFKVSILVPIYNAEKYFERCVRSLFEQTYENIEFVFVDDCSSDASISILRIVAEEYPSRKKQIKLIQNSFNRGASASKNIAIDNSTGDFVCFVDADDWIEIDAVELLVSQQNKTGADVVWGKMLMHTNSGTIELGEPNYANKTEWILCYCRLTTGLVMTNSRRIIRRNLLSRYNIKSVEGFNYAEDKLLMSQVAYYANGFSTIENIIYHYNRQNDSAATTKQGFSGFNIDVFRQESGSIHTIETFFSDKEQLYKDEIGKARVRFLRDYLDRAIHSKSQEGFYLIVNQIKSSNPYYWDVIGWNNWKRFLYGNYYYMRYSPTIKRRIKHLIGLS